MNKVMCNEMIMIILIMIMCNVLMKVIILK